MYILARGTREPVGGSKQKMRNGHDIRKEIVSLSFDTKEHESQKSYPGKLSLNPFNHIAQLSVAKLHSPTITGPNSLSIRAI